MESQPIELDAEKKLHLTKATGCGLTLLLIFLFIWVAGFSSLNLFIRWAIEQSMYESDTGISDLRWVVQLVYALLMLMPLVPIYFTIKVPRIKLMSGLWIIGVVFVLFTIPAKTLYLTSQVQSFTLITAALLLMILVLLILRKTALSKSHPAERSNLLGSAALAGLALSIPWILWGSLGSALDTILVILLAISAGVFVVLSVFPYYLEKTQDVEAKTKIGEYVFDGAVVAVFLLIVVTGLAQNGSQTLLVFSLPAAGWILTAFSIAGRNQSDHGRQAAGILTGLLVALPLLFFDVDELSEVISGSAGEVVQWAGQAGLYTLIFLMAASLGSMLFFKNIPRMNIPGKINLALTGISIIVFGFVYMFFGQPGFFGDQLFVILEEQVDPSVYAQLEPLEERNVALYQALTMKAQQSQAPLREKLDRMGIEYNPYYLVNGMEVNGGLLLQMWLEKQPEVDRVLSSPHLRPLPELVTAAAGEENHPPDGTLWNLEMIRVPLVHEKLNITGSGIVIGQTDSGIEGNHPELKTSYRGAGGSDDYNWVDPWFGAKTPVDYAGHGTATLGIEVGSTRGIAPDAQWIGCVNLARNLGNPAYYLNCMQFMFAPYPRRGDPFLDGDTTLGANIVNNSWGCPRVEGCDAEVFEPAMRVLKTAGIFMSAAAGNAGYYGCSTITDPPAIYEDVFTAGAVDKTGTISSFSSLGPVIMDGNSRIKPDLLAPGEQILLAAPGGKYTFASGTSFAAPHISGVVALMWSANPKLIGDIETTTRLLIENTQPYNGVDAQCGDARNGSGAGILDAFAAVQAAIDLKLGQ